MKKIIVLSEIDESLQESFRRYLGSRSHDSRSLVREFQNISIKNIQPKPREVRISAELKKHHLFQVEKKKVIQEIISRIESGESIDTYLSDKSVQLSQYDASLAHFGTHHLHLGERIQNHGSRAGRVKGTKSLLFAKFTESCAYLIDILNHDMRMGFLNMHLFRVMHNNWPDLVQPFRLKGAVKAAINYTDDEVAELLEGNVNVIVEMAHGKVFALPGMGTTTAGTPLIVEKRVDDTIRALRCLVQIIEDNVELVAREIRAVTGVGYNVIRLQVRIRAGEMEVYDASSGCAFFLQESTLGIAPPSAHLGTPAI